MKRFQVYLNSDELAQISSALALVVHKCGSRDLFGQARDAEKLAIDLAVQLGQSREAATAQFKKCLAVLEGKTNV